MPFSPFSRRRARVSGRPRESSLSADGAAHDLQWRRHARPELERRGRLPHQHRQAVDDGRALCLRLGEEAGQAAGVDEVDDELPRNQVIGQTPGYLNGPGHAQGRRVDDEGVSLNEGLVEAAPGDDARGGLGWRTRIMLAVDPRGRAGMYRYRSRDVIPLRDMPLAAPAIADLDLFARRWPAGSRIEAVAPVGGDRPLVLLDGEPLKGERRAVRERVVLAGREHVYKVSGSGFWQVHDAAPALLAEAVLHAAGPLEGAHVLDLYAGSGLFTVPLAEAVGPDGHVDAVEGDARAVRDARRNVHALAQVAVHGGDVAEVIGDLAVGPGAVVVLDPPRTGAGAEVTAAIAATEPARIVYVACDPAALARDLRVAASRGYGLTSLRAVDLFPHTHHVECVAVLERA